MNDTLRQWLLHTGFYVFGIVTGATGMIYIYEQPKPAKPVVTVEQGRERSSGDHPASNPITHDAAPPRVDLAFAKQMYLEKVVAKEKNATRMILELDRLQQQVNRLQLELDRRNALMAEMRRETAAVLQVRR